MKFLVTFFLSVLILLACIQVGFSQDITFQRLEGFEDENSNTQLYYLRQITQPCEYLGYNNDFIISSDLFHYDTSNSSDSLRFFGTRNNVNTERCYTVSFDKLIDYHVDSVDSNFVIAIKSGTDKYEDNLIYGSVRMYHPGYSINFLRHPYSSTDFLIEYIPALDPQKNTNTKALHFKYLNSESPADTLDFGENLGYKFLNPSSKRTDSLLFFIKSDTLYKTTNLNKTSVASLQNVTHFIAPQNNSVEITNTSYFDIYHRKDSDLIYWFIDVRDTRSDSVFTYLLKNSNRGEINRWEVNPLLLSSRIAFSKSSSNHYAISSDSVLFASREKSLFQSTNAGENFSPYLTFDYAITGIYAKPNSSIIYVLTEKKLYKVEKGQPTSIKQVPVSNEETPEIPTSVSLKQNYPNPFNPTTTIQFELDKATFTKLTVYDVLGRKVRELVNQIRPAGTNTIQFDATNLASGIYLYRLEANGVIQTKRLTLIK